MIEGVSCGESSGRRFRGPGRDRGEEGVGGMVHDRLGARSWFPYGCNVDSINPNCSTIPKAA